MTKKKRITISLDDEEFALLEKNRIKLLNRLPGEDGLTRSQYIAYLISSANELVDF